MLGLCSDETYGAMKNYDDGDDDGNEDRNDDDNAASGSGSDGLVFDPITTPQSHRGGSGDDGDGRYDRGALYIYNFKYVPITDVL